MTETDREENEKAPSPHESRVHSRAGRQAGGSHLQAASQAGSDLAAQAWATPWQGPHHNHVSRIEGCYEYHMVGYNMRRELDSSRRGAGLCGTDWSHVQRGSRLSQQVHPRPAEWCKITWVGEEYYGPGK